MNVHYTARHVLLTPELRAYAEKRLAGLGRLLDASAEVDVILAAEKSRKRVDIQVRGRRDRILVSENGHDPSEVLNAAFDVLEKRMRKEREKFREKKRRSGRDVRTMTPAAERSELPPRVVRAEYFTSKPMAVREALVEFTLRKKEVLMFRPEGDEDHWAVLFRRKDGSFGLVRPE